MLEYARIPEFQNRNIPKIKISRILDRNSGIWEYSRLPTIPSPSIPVEEFWNIPEFLLFLGQDSWRGILEYSRIPIIPRPGFQNSYYSWARTPGQEFWNIPEFLLFLGQDSWLCSAVCPASLLSAWVT